MELAYKRFSSFGSRYLHSFNMSWYAARLGNKGKLRCLVEPFGHAHHCVFRPIPLHENRSQVPSPINIFTSATLPLAKQALLFAFSWNKNRDGYPHFFYLPTVKYYIHDQLKHAFHVCWKPTQNISVPIMPAEVIVSITWRCWGGEEVASALKRKELRNNGYRMVWFCGMNASADKLDAGIYGRLRPSNTISFER